MGILTHRFISTVADGPYSTQVQPSNWNEPHSFTGGTHGSLVMRDTTTASSSEGISWLTVLSAPKGAVLVSPSSSAAPFWWQGTGASSSQTDVTTSTLANVPGLSVSLSSQRTYMFEAVAYTTSSSASGVKFAISGTATATTIIYEGVTNDTTLISAHTRASSLGTAVGGVNNVTAAIAKINGTILVNAAGTLTVQFAQNTSSASASSILQGSTLRVWQVG